MRRKSNKWQPTLVFRQNRNMRWIWELVDRERHVLNRSQCDFATKSECVQDAVTSGQSLDNIRPRARQSIDNR